MQLKSAPVSSSKRREFSPTGSRLKKKHKRLDAISEDVYNQNHGESREGKVGSPSGGDPAAESDLRRSSRVRRAPVLLDASPPPVKKRKKIDKNVKSGVKRGEKIGLDSAKKEGERLKDLDTPGSWKSRLRTRARNVVMRERGETSRRRKLFDEIGGVDNNLDEKKEELDGGQLMVVRSKRPGRVKAVNSLSEGKDGEKHGGGSVSGDVEAELSMRINESVKDDMEDAGGKGDDSVSISDSESGSQNEGEHSDACVGLDEEQEVEKIHDLGLENEVDEVDSAENVVQSDDNREEMESPKGGNGICETGEIGRYEGGDNKVESGSGKEDIIGRYEGGEKKVELGSGMEELGSGKDGKSVNGEGGEENLELESGAGSGRENERNVVDVAFKNNMEDGGRPGEDDVLMKVDQMPLEGEKDTEAYKSKHDSTINLGPPRIKQGRRCGLCGSGTDGKPPKRLLQSADGSENEIYSGSSASEELSYDIWDGFGDEPGWLGRLLGPINDRYGIAGIWVHQNCAVWSPEVYFAGWGCLKSVRAALCRGKALKCTRCGRPGATIGCRVDRCPRTYHLPCARANGCIFDHRKFLIACTDHRYLFQPHGNQYTMRIKKLKAKKMKLEVRKLSNDAWRKDVEAEEKWLENCGEDDEFLKRESKRLHRDLLRIAPVYIGGSDFESGKLFEGWESVAGLRNVIQCMKEVVILPLLYPEFFNNLGITPPRGVLLHGYPGTGKTLVVRALIGACARGDKRIAYFARKGADCLGKYVGDAERQLRLLFQVAERSQPSIIFFDEIDGLAPSRTTQQDQTHSSVVSTLLALMDGLKSRGSVVVIGATNRPEAVDPALRRPGRFDREIYFPLPSVEDRASILSLHTQRWPKPVTGSLLKWIATRTVGFAGADLQALCTQAAIVALKRNFPLQEVLSSAAEKASDAKRPLPSFVVEERDWLEALAVAPPPCSRREAGIAAFDLVSSPLPQHLIPCLLNPLSTMLVSLYLDKRLRLPSPIVKSGKVVKSVILSSMEKKSLPTDRWWFHVDNLLKEADVAKEVQRRLSCSGILGGETSYTDADAFVDDDNGGKFESNRSMHNILFRQVSFSPKGSGFWALIAGSPRSGQRHLASCILHGFVGNMEIQKVDMATISQEGHGDMVQGINQILMKCASLKSCMIYMPRIDLWAVETCQQISESDASSISHQPSDNVKSCASSTDHQPYENRECWSTHDQVVEEYNESTAPQIKAAETEEPHGVSHIASHAWSSFIEQVESICVSTSLMILATSELTYPELPCMIKQFFKSDILKSTQPNPLEDTVLRFSVNLDENFDKDEVISHSAALLSSDIARAFVQLIHQRAHIYTNRSGENQVGDSIQSGLDRENKNEDHCLVKENGGKIHCPHYFSSEIPPRPNRSLKGKSSLVLAISTFGYQILCYPHFAELCWFTSKLKEGPCVDVSGPWKGWPFNSCIIRPSNLIDKVALASSSSSIKSKERSGLVRGLIAVGLSAYRGVYESLREVSFEIRNVLELLVGQVNERIQAGKDRYQYLRLMSQVAYFEDMVNSWVFSLQSLELDVQKKLAISRFNAAVPVDNSVQSDQYDSKASIGSPHHSVFAPENIEGVELNKGDDGLDPIPEGRTTLPEYGLRAAVAEDGSVQQIGGHTNSDRHPEDEAALQKDGSVEQINGHPNPDKVLQISCSDAQVIGDITNEQNGNVEVQFVSSIGITSKQNATASGQCEPGIIEDVAANDGHCDSAKHFNVMEPVVSSENGFSTKSELDACRLIPQQASNKSNGRVETDSRSYSDDAEHKSKLVDVSPPRKTSSLPVSTGVECMYRCCSGCLSALHTMIQKMLIHDWALNKSRYTAEDVHDVVASLSVDLLSAVRKADPCGSISSSVDQEPGHHNPNRTFECPGLHKCHCTSSGNGSVVTMECGCPVDECFATKDSDSSNSAKVNNSLSAQFGLDLIFVLRDGILVPVESNKNVSFHCKYKALCLCSLIELIEMMKRPFD